ncbi:MAG: D-glycerate dehydrogenase [Candidatus Dormibacteria bacterium]|jgi:glyoxylate reductase
MADVLCTLALPDPFPACISAVATLRVLGRVPTASELCQELASRPADVLCPQLADSISAEVLDAGMPRLRGVCVYAVGHNNVDVAAATQRGIAVGNTPGVLTAATADLAIALLLAASRRIVEGDAAVRAGEFRGWAPDYMLGLDLQGAQLGIVGFGRIGEAVARRALAFGMRIGTVRHGAAGVPPDLASSVQIFDSLEALLAASDAVSLHTPLTERTWHLIDEAALRRMKPTAVLVNTARGAVVDEEALVRALREGWIAGCGLDVYEDEPRLAPGLAGCRNAVLSPHLGSATVRTRRAMAALTADNALGVLAGGLPPHCVNPEVGERPR